MNVKSPILCNCHEWHRISKAFSSYLLGLNLECGFDKDFNIVKIKLKKVLLKHWKSTLRNVPLHYIVYELLSSIQVYTSI